MKIYNAKGETIVDLDVEDNSYRYRAIMEANSLTLRYALEEHVEIPVGAYCIFENQRFTLFRPEHLSMRNTRNFEYTVLMYSDELRSKHWKFRNPVDGRLKFSLTAKPKEHLQMFVDNMNRRDTGWTVGDYIEGTETLINYDHDYCWDALSKMASKFETEFIFEGKRVSLCKMERFKNDPLPLSYGKGKGFKTGVGRSNDGENPPTEILYVQGGTQNIDLSKYGYSELHLPKLATLQYDGQHFEGEDGFSSANARQYITDNLGLSVRRNDKNPSSLAEDSLDGSKHYPKRVGTVSSVVVVDAAKNFYDIVDDSIPASLNFENCLIGDEKMTIIFQSGELVGRGEFEVKYVHEAKAAEGSTPAKAGRRFEIVPQEIDGMMMPGGSYVPKVGDTYAVFHCWLPDSYIADDETKTGAEWDMFRDAVRYLYEHEDLKFSFTGTLDGLWAKKDWANIGGRLVLGSYILFSDPNFQPDGVKVRIVGIKDYINNPHKPEIELSNSTVATGVGTTLKELKSEEVTVDDYHKDAIQYSKRRFRDAKETIGMLEDALLENFTNSINPIAVQTMSLLVGDESLQFVFVAGPSSNTVVADTVNYNQETKQLTIGTSYIKHMTLGIDSLSSSNRIDTYKRWSLPAFTSAVLSDPAKKYYLYARVSEYSNSGTFRLQENAVALRGEAGYYHLLVGVLNSAYDGERSFATLYGFTEILPGRITTDRIVSGNGNSYFDMLNNAMALGDRLKFNVNGDGLLRLYGTLVQSQSGDESPLGCYRGVYSSSYTYYKGDEVIYAINGLYSLYRQVNDSSCRNIPPTNTRYWALQASAGSNGDWYKFVYRHSIERPATPTGTNPVGWSDTPDLENITYQHGSTFSLINGYYQSPSTAHSSISTNRITFSTARPNQVVAIEIVASCESNFDFGIIGKLDTNLSTSNYTDRVTGTQRKVAFVDVPTAGSHYIEIGYSKDVSGIGGDDCIKYRILKVENCWLSTARVGGASGEAGSWSVPIPFSMDSNDTERIYKLSATDTRPTTPQSDPYVDDYVPTGWTDNPTGVTYQTPFEFEAVRHKRDGKWSDFSSPVVWMRYSFNGDYYEERYAVNGSTTAPPSIDKSTRSPSGWSTTQPPVGSLQYLWRTVAKISGELGTLLSDWSTPVRITPYDGKDGEQGTSPALIYRGEYSSTKTYYGTAHRVEAVKYGSAYYVTRTDAGEFYGVVPTNTDKWNSFGASFESIATNLLLAENANVANFIFKNGLLQSQDGVGGVPNIQFNGKTGVGHLAAGNFYWDTEGNIYGKNGTFEGVIKATKGFGMKTWVLTAGSAIQLTNQDNLVVIATNLNASQTFTLTLPNAPIDGQMLAICISTAAKIEIDPQVNHGIRRGSSTLTSTSRSLTTLFGDATVRGITIVYSASTYYWYVVGSDIA